MAEVLHTQPAPAPQKPELNLAGKPLPEVIDSSIYPNDRRLQTLSARVNSRLAQIKMRADISPQTREKAEMQWPTKWENIPAPERNVLLTQYNGLYNAHLETKRSNFTVQEKKQLEDTGKVILQDPAVIALEKKISEGTDPTEEEISAVNEILKKYEDPIKIISDFQKPPSTAEIQGILAKNPFLWTSTTVKPEEFGAFMEDLQRNIPIANEQLATAQQHIVDEFSKEKVFNKDHKEIPKNSSAEYFIQGKVQEIKAYPPTIFGEGFSEIVQFVNGNGSLSENGKMVLYDMTGGDQAKISKTEASFNKTFEREHQKKNPSWGDMQKNNEHEIYQVACHRIAEEAKAKLPPNFVADMQKSLGRSATGHTVEHRGADNIKAQNIDASKRVGQVDLQNFIIYEGVASVAMLSFAANLMIAVGSGDFVGNVMGNETLLVDAAVMYGTYKGIGKQAINKMMYPQDMAVHILREVNMLQKAEILAYENEFQFFQRGINWGEPGDKTVKNALKELRKNHKDAKKEEEESLSVEDLGKEPMTSILTPEGKAKLATLGHFEKGENPEEMDKKRYAMVEDIAGRRGQYDDLLPQLHTLHKYANQAYFRPAGIPMKPEDSPFDNRTHQQA
ncbi:MAG: hypothetical protein WCJ84_00820 [Candidatus Peregrinibacteria bacterium]